MFVLAASLQGQTATKKRVTFFAPGSVYVYVQGGMAWVNPDHYIYDSKESAIAPVFGLGFRAVNFHDRSYLALEFDYSQAKYGTGYFDTRVRFYNFKIVSEFRFGRKRDVSFTTALGIGSITYPDEGDYGYYQNGEITLLVEFGVKVKLIKHVSLRTDLRLFAEPESSGDYYDEYYYNDDSRLIASSLAIGLQFDF